MDVNGIHGLSGEITGSTQFGVQGLPGKEGPPGPQGKPGVNVDSVNVALYGILPGRDCSKEINELLKTERSLYFPEGVYTLESVFIPDDTIIRIHPKARLHTFSGRMFQAYNCSLKIIGGQVSSGIDYPNRAYLPRKDSSRTLITGEAQGIIELFGCYDCVFDGIHVPYSSSGSVIEVYGDSTGTDDNGNEINRPVTVNGQSVVPERCRNIRITGCQFNNFLLSAVHVLYGNDNIVIDNCSFTDVLRSNTGDYCYTCYTGVKSVNNDKSIRYTPTNGYVFRNCYVNNCEGTGIDSHAASNVCYENNILIDCDNFITAYHDYRRVKTKDGWVMENIVVRNNICRTTKAFDYAANSYPHPPFMLYNQGSLGTMRNIIVENNIVETNYDLEGSEMVLFRGTENINFRNNTFISNGSVEAVSTILACYNVNIDGLTVKGNYTDVIQFHASLCNVGHIICGEANVSGAVLSIPKERHSFVDTDRFTTDTTSIPLVNNWEYALNRCNKTLQSNEAPSAIGAVCTLPGYYGKTKKASIGTTVEGNTVTSATAMFIPGTMVQFAPNDDAERYFITEVKSYWKTEDDQVYVYVLDRVPSEEDAKLNIRVCTPYAEAYNEPIDSYDLAQKANKKVDILADLVSHIHTDVIEETASGAMVAIPDAAEKQLRGMRIFGTKDIGVNGRVKICVYGRNLFPFPYSSETVTTSGITFTVNEDGSVTLNGTATASVAFGIVSSSKTTVILPKGEYFLSGCPAGGSPSTYSIVLRNMDSSFRIYDTGEGTHFTVSEPMQIHCTIYILKGKNVDGLVFKPMISVGNSAKPYERKPLQYLEVSLPNGLAGRTVSSGGNYTDENGQQWLCDEVDFSQGVIIQRVGTDGAMAEPVETELSAEEMAAYSALHTNYPDTMVLNDAGADMEVVYVADIKKYIDKKIGFL